MPTTPIPPMPRPSVPPPTPNPKGQTKYDIELELIGLSENKYNEFMDLYHKFINKDMSYSIKVYVNA